MGIAAILRDVERVDRQRSCDTKRPYGSEEVAMQKASRLMARSDGERKLVAYRCRFCDSWHVGKAARDARS